MKHFLAAILLALSVSAASACPYKRLSETQDAIANASGCHAAMLLYESCGAKASSLDHLAALADPARGRCEAVFYGKVNQRDMRAYKTQRLKCDNKLQAMRGVAPLVTAKMLCGPYAAYHYARAFTALQDRLKADPDPKL